LNGFVVSRYRSPPGSTDSGILHGDALRDERMPEQAANTSAEAPPESPYALQLRRGFPRLNFELSLEAEFRRVYRAESLPQIRRNLWLAVAFVIGLSAVTHVVLSADVNRLMDLIRLATLAPILLFAIVLVHSRLYDRLYPLASLIAAPAFGAGIVVLAVIAAMHGVNLIATVVLTTIYIYFLLGMQFYAAFGAAITVLASYVVAAMIAGAPGPAVWVDVAMLAGANIVGAMVCYTLEHAKRTSFLEERLLTETANRDGLTGIYNRRMFDEHLARIWPQAIRDAAPLGLLLIDVDHFKAYNDHYGHQAGDERLKSVAWSLNRVARRPFDIAARYGGEEFAIVLYDARRDHIEEAAKRIQADVEALAIQHLASSSPLKRLTVSIGAACVAPAGGRSSSGFIQLADEALYAAKERGRNCVVVMDKEYSRLTTGAFRSGAAARSNV
jgi:diguanylate cyclase (GGDEF)-like protein